MILHGFTANLDSVRELFPPLRAMGLRLNAPLLKGHGSSSPDELRGVVWQDWLSDAERALKTFAGADGCVVIIGHSMGALLALHLAARYPEMVDSLVLVTPAIRLVSLLAPGRPLHFLAPLISRFLDRWGLQTTMADPGKAIMPNQYGWAPTRTILSFFDLVANSESVLGKVRAPVLILHNRKESIVLPESADIVYRRIATPAAQKRIVWLERSDHQVFCDCERAVAVGAAVDFIAERFGGCRAHPETGTRSVAS